MKITIKHTRRLAAGALAGAALFAAGCGSSSSSNASTTTAAAAANAAATQGGGPPAGARGGGPGQGTPVVGPAAAKVKAAALAKYPGTIEIIEQLPAGSYVAHVIKSDKSEVHVLVSKTFKVTGVESGPPGGGPGGAPPSGGAAPSSSGTAASGQTA